MEKDQDKCVIQIVPATLSILHNANM